MPNLSIDINYRRPFGSVKQLFCKEGVTALAHFVQQIAAGRECDSVLVGFNDSVAPNSNSSYTGQAAALVKFGATSGAVGAVIGGTSITVTHDTNGTKDCAAFVAKAKADATVGMFARVRASLAKMTVASVAAGDGVEVHGTRFTAIANGATPTAFGQFSVGASDTACAANLAAAINQHYSLSGYLTAVSDAAVVYVADADEETNTMPLKNDGIRYPSSTITVNVPTGKAGTVCMVLAATPGTIGNFVTLTASGTGVTVVTGGTSGQLGGGRGGAPPANSLFLVP